MFVCFFPIVTRCRRDGLGFFLFLSGLRFLFHFLELYFKEKTRSYSTPSDSSIESFKEAQLALVSGKTFLAVFVLQALSLNGENG